MVGYPFFYKNKDLDHKDLDQDKISMIFSLDPVTENLEVNLTKTVALAIVTDTAKLGLGDQFSYEICDQILQICGTLSVIPQTKTLVMEYKDFCQLAAESDTIFSNISYNLSITKDQTMEEAQRFFRNNKIIVQASGAQGALYKVGSCLQSAGSAGLVANTMILAKLAGVTGLQILKAQPILVVAIPTTGSIFFYGCAAIVGNNPLGKTLVTTGDVLAIPMKGVEIIWNCYANPIMQKVFGIPIILNMTQAFKIGPGYTLKEISAYIPINQKSILKTVKEKMIKWLS
jgi:hypothetical protein